MIRVRDRDLFDIVVEEADTLARFLLDSGGEGTGRRVVDGCVSLLQREGSLRNASRYGERPLNRRWEARNSRFF